MKKRVLAILLVISMVSVTACGAKKQDASTKSEDKDRVIKQADIVPGYVQDANYADLGSFGVMKLKQTGQIDMKSGNGEVQDIDGSTAYGVLPESRIGTDDMVNSLYCSEFSFYYSAYISLIAYWYIQA